MNGAYFELCDRSCVVTACTELFSLTYVCLPTTYGNHAYDFTLIINERARIIICCA
jgi:hypothetical protein